MVVVDEEGSVGGRAERTDGADVDADGFASALDVPLRNGRSNASLSRATFFGPKPGNRASCAASACAILAKLCHITKSRGYMNRNMSCRKADMKMGRTPKEVRRVSTSVLFTRGMLVSAVRRSALGVLSTRSRMSVGARCSDCL